MRTDEIANKLEHFFVAEKGFIATPTNRTKENGKREFVYSAIRGGVDNQSYLCRYQIQLRGEQAWFKAKIYWVDPNGGQFGLKLIPE